MLEANGQAVELLGSMLRLGDYALIKGSRGAAMEAIVASLQRRPMAELQHAE
jgi:UDP-N-acetylmuramyl pentapeptide synthase